LSSEPTPELVGRFRSVLEQRLGWAFEPSRLGHLLEVLEARASLHGGDRLAYVGYLEKAPASDELRALARNLTVTETYFFRNRQQFIALRHILRSEYAGPHQRQVRMLSAGCASGEEPYSLAVLQREALADSQPSVVGIDINVAALERARLGRFSAWSVRDTEKERLERWFERAGNDFVIAEPIRRSVRFAEGNLMVENAELLGRQSYDVIFCRNVLMYFSQENSRRVVERLARALVPGGYLFLGSAETLRGVSDDFQLCHSHDAFYYRRQERAPREAISDAGTASWAESIDRAAARIAALGSAERAAPAAPVSPDPAPPSATDLEVALQLLQREQFAEALEHLRGALSHQASNPDVLLLEAVLLASMGQLPAAEQACQRLLASDELSAGAHYVLALCAAAKGGLEAAVHHDRIATYLAPEFAMPRLHMGLLLRRAGDRAASRQELTRARTLLEREDAQRLALFGGGFSRRALLALCAAELGAAEDHR
jgi:chemotaxis protein methyltransferase CheR